MNRKECCSDNPDGEGMLSTVTRLLTLPYPLGAMLASQIVRAVSCKGSTITIESRGWAVNGKSVVELIGLQADAGATLVVTASGVDALEAMDSIEKVLAYTPFRHEGAPTRGVGAQL